MQQCKQVPSEHVPQTQRIVVVHVKLTERERNALKAVLSLEGLTMQAYFAAKAAEKIANDVNNGERVVR
jgi:hypothetical protein